VRHITEAGDENELSAEQVAGYVAKYATKATEAVGVTLDHRISAEDLEDLEELDVPAHVAELVRACFELAARPSLAGLRLRKWAHMLGFGGHFSSKSRRYSVTLGALRQARVAYAIRRRRGDAIPLDAWGGRRTTKRRSWSPPGPTWAGATRAPGRRGWPPRRPLGLGKRGASPRRSYEPQRWPRESRQGARLRGWTGC
jgi:hypothetical protein